MWDHRRPSPRLRPFWHVVDRGPKLYSIPVYKPFADSLVDGLIDQCGGDGAALAQGLILVPNNRAAMAIQDAFVRRASAGLLLPRMVAIGDPDLGENVGSALDPADAAPIPPAIDPLQRQMMLARKLQQTIPAERMGRVDAAQAMRLAAELGRVVDQLAVERKTLADLRRVSVDGLSEHWDASRALLESILADWPAELAALGRIDMAERRNQQLARVAERWRTDPPPGFVVAAGISTAAPAIVELVRQVTRLERGQLVLAGVDMSMPGDQWDALAGGEGEPAIESHPQYHLCLLLERLGYARSDVQPWPSGKAQSALKTRSDTVSTAMAPALFTRDWAGLPPDRRKLKGVRAIEVATPAEEAQAIALALREAVTVPGRTAALVTPDRVLARRVCAHLTRWGITADDSAGQPLSATLPGTLIQAIAAAAAERFAPAALLTLLKHPLVTGGMDRREWLDGARKLDLALRGPRPAPDLAGVDGLLAIGEPRTANIRAAALEWWPSAKALLTPLEVEQASLAAMIGVVRDTATALASDRCWAGQEGRAAADLIAALEEHSEAGPQDVARDALPLLLRDAMDGVAIRPARGGHPRIFIWGLLEAKLQSADLMILGGLNETVWPQLAAPDPWLAPAIRRQLDLPSLERRIGLSAHDLVSALAAPDVMLSRAKRDARSPTIASRFWLRLETLANGFEAPKLRFDLLARQLDYAEGKRAEQPKEAPPAAERPRAISVTEVDGLMADPYSFYAKKMLKLSAMNAPGEEPDAKWRGTFLHDVLYKWGRDDAWAAGTLLPKLRAAFDGSGLHPVVRAMWQPRFEEAASFFEARVTDQREEGRQPIAAEVKGVMQIAGVSLTGRADRIDGVAGGELAIIDYKTGKAPSDSQVKEGFALQLGLIGFLATCGAFDGVAGTPTAFEYWSQARDSKTGYGRITSPTKGKGTNKSDPADFVERTYHQFEEAVEKWLLGDAPFTAKRRPEYAYSEFDQLMRYDEWRGRNG